MKLQLVLCGALLAAGAARAELPPETVRAIHEANKDSVLMLAGTVKFQFQREREIQVAGPVTVVDTNGLLITSASTVRLPMSARKTEIRESTLKVKLPSGAEVLKRITYLVKPKSLKYFWYISLTALNSFANCSTVQ